MRTLCVGLSTQVLPVLLAIWPAPTLKASVVADPRFYTRPGDYVLCHCSCSRILLVKSREPGTNPLPNQRPNRTEELCIPRRSEHPGFALKLLAQFVRLVIGEMLSLIQTAAWDANRLPQQLAYLYVCASEAFCDTIAIVCHFVSCVGSVALDPFHISRGFPRGCRLKRPLQRRA